MYYINTGSNTGKAKWLVEKAQAEVISKDEAQIIVEDSIDHGVICVIDNGMFEAAGYAFSPSEFQAFARNDGRMKTWLKMPAAMAKKLSGFG